MKTDEASEPKLWSTPELIDRGRLEEILKDGNCSPNDPGGDKDDCEA